MTFAVLVILAGAPRSGHAAPVVDTSGWKCEQCPFEKPGSRGVVEGGAGLVTHDSARFGDFNGLDRKGGFLVLDADAQHRGEAGLYGRATVADFGLDSRAFTLNGGREGLFDLTFGHAQLPRRLSENASTPFLGTGSERLTLPLGYPAASTAAMPLAGRLAPVALGYDRWRTELGLAWQLGPQWSTKLSIRSDERHGTQRTSGAFFATAAQLAAPLSQTTNQFEASAAYQAGTWQASVAYQASLFSNDIQSLSWSNPFTPGVAGATTGQLALAPSNQFHQLVASGGWDIAPRIRASGEVAFGRMTQDESYLAATLNPSLAVPALPAASYGGQVDTFNAGARVSAVLDSGLRLQASYARDVRDNRSASLAYPAVSSDMFLGTAARLNQPFGFTQDRFKLSGDMRAFGVRFSAGAEIDLRSRTLQEEVSTKETTLWARAAARPLAGLSLALKLAHGDRSGDGYGVATWIAPPENPLLRKFNLADRRRDKAQLRGDYAVTDNVSVGMHADFARDRYDRSPLGLTDGRTQSLGADISVGLSEQTQLHAFAQSERMRSRQSGSQTFASADWWGEHRDQVDLLGLGLKHQMLKGALELGADMAFSRTRSDLRVDVLTASGGDYPRATGDLDSVRLHAAYRLSAAVSITGSYGYERLQSQDWRFDGVTPAAIPNLLALGATAAQYRLHVLRVGLRLRF